MWTCRPATAAASLCGLLSVLLIACGSGARPGAAPAANRPLAGWPQTVVATEKEVVVTVMGLGNNDLSVVLTQTFQQR